MSYIRCGDSIYLALKLDDFTLAYMHGFQKTKTLQGFLPFEGKISWQI